MNQEDCVEQILVCMKSIRPMSPDICKFIQMNLYMAFAVGFDEGYRIHTNRKRVAQIKNGIIIHVFNSQTEASKMMGVNNRTINKAVHKQIKSCKGYEWMEID
jgi:hypothetical protein